MALAKADLIKKISKANGFSRKKSSEAVETLLKVMKKTLESGKDILVSGFGKFCVKEKSERRGRNPATGDKMMLASKKVVTFQCSRVLRKRFKRR